MEFLVFLSFKPHLFFGRKLLVPEVGSDPGKWKNIHFFEVHSWQPLIPLHSPGLHSCCFSKCAAVPAFYLIAERVWGVWNLFAEIRRKSFTLDFILLYWWKEFAEQEPIGSAGAQIDIGFHTIWQYIAKSLKLWRLFDPITPRLWIYPKEIIVKDKKIYEQGCSLQHRKNWKRLKCPSEIGLVDSDILIIRNFKQSLK